MANIPFEVQSKNVDEIHPKGVSVYDIPVHLAQLKAKAFSNEITNEVVIGADTVVILNGSIFEKPTSEQNAINMLLELSGKTHEVVTGVCIFSKQKEVNFSCLTKVIFNELSYHEVEFYVQKFQPFDKAGSYACQEWIGAVGIKSFEGDYFNVVGLPINKVYQVLVNDFELNFI